MDLFVSLPVTPGGVLAAAACAVAGAPLFARGLRAFRLGRRIDALREKPLADDAGGLVRVRGRVALESPLFAPLSGTPCAGFQLEVRGANSKVGDVIRDQRAFRLQAGEASALVPQADCDWHTPVTAERELGPSEVVSERLASLLDSSNEIRWLRERGVALQVIERALEAGRVVSVVGVATHERIAAGLEEAELAATGTDGGAFQGSRMLPGAAIDTYQLQLRTDDTFQRVQVFADPPEQALARPSRWEAAWLALGPTLTLLALLYLARAAEPLLTRTP